MNSIVITSSTDPHYNLALEELLFETQKGFCLYLWQNQNTVVIGRNQNAWKECRISLLEEEGGRLARRSSGGGAVFHDLGNLNFTFIVPSAAYDIPRQLSVILSAVKSLGIAAEFTGRNDIVTASGAKFSGNAFRRSPDACMHHGTLLIDTDMEKLGRYLVPSKAKLAAKGVESIRSRVTNLVDEMPSLTLDAMKDALCAAFQREYGCAKRLEESELDAALLREKAARYASWEWNKGASPAFDASLTNRFSWGEITLELSLKDGCIAAAKVWSDSMDETFAPALARVLTGCRFKADALAKAVESIENREAAEAAAWFREISF